MMKLLALVLVSTMAYSQKAIPDESVIPTTQEEYNYLTKGYKIMLESGLDVKKGYVIKDVVTVVPSANYTFEFKYLTRESGELAGILVVAKSTMWGNNIYYLCIPNTLDNPLYQDYLKAIAAWDKSMLLEYQKAYTVFTYPYIPLRAR